jgi:hypothetical protein
MKTKVFCEIAKLRLEIVYTSVKRWPTNQRLMQNSKTAFGNCVCVCEMEVSNVKLYKYTKEQTLSPSQGQIAANEQTQTNTSP